MDTLACLELSLCALMTNIRQIVIIESAAGCLYTHLNTRLLTQLSIYGCFFAVFSLLDHRIKCTIVALNLLLHKSFTLMIVGRQKSKETEMDPSAVLHTAFVSVLTLLEHLLQLSCIKISYLLLVFDQTLPRQFCLFPSRGSSVKSQSFSVNRAVC